jgi:hypothetical protein
MQSQELEMPATPIRDIEISGQWFLAYQLRDVDEGPDNQFLLRRGYLTFRKRFNEVLSVRFTQDITRDTEGDDAGNIEMRLKYLYLRVDQPFRHSFIHSFITFGMVSRPWIDFEEKINRFRLQQSMFPERSGLLNSADFGVTFSALLGGELDKAYREKVSRSFPGKYGSLVLGVYNGGGYHALEANNNKTVEGRLSLRPFPGRLPGLQGSIGFAAGKGNIAECPDFLMQQAALSYESVRLRFFLQWIGGRGNSFGTFIRPDFEAEPFSGYAAFGEYHFCEEISIMMRADHFSRKMLTGNHDDLRLSGGLCYHFLNGQKALLSTSYLDELEGISRIYEAVIEIRF